MAKHGLVMGIFGALALTPAGAAETEFGQPLPAHWSRVAGGKSVIWREDTTCGPTMRLAIEGHAVTIQQLVQDFNDQNVTRSTPIDGRDYARGERRLYALVRDICPETRTLAVRFIMPRTDGQLAFWPQRESVALGAWEKLLAEQTRAPQVSAEALTGRLTGSAAVAPGNDGPGIGFDEMAFKASFVSAWGDYGRETVADLPRVIAGYQKQVADADRAYPADPYAAIKGVRALMQLVRLGVQSGDFALAGDAADKIGRAISTVEPDLMAQNAPIRANTLLLREALCVAVAGERIANTMDAATFRTWLVEFADRDDLRGIPCREKANFTLAQLALADGDIAEASRRLARSRSPVARFFEASMMLRGLVPGTAQAVLAKYAEAERGGYAPAAISAAQMVFKGQATLPNFGRGEAIRALAQVATTREGTPIGTLANDLYRRNLTDADRNAGTYALVGSIMAISSAVNSFCEGRKCGDPAWVSRRQDDAIERQNAAWKASENRRFQAGLEAMGGNPGALLFAY